MRVLSSDIAGFYGKLMGYPIVENRFVSRTKAYILEDRTIIVHPDVADRLRGYRGARLSWRRFVRWLRWRFITRPRYRRELKHEPQGYRPEGDR